MCFGFIYDILCFPLPTNHPMKPHIHMPSLKRYSTTITKIFQECTSVFKHGPLFFTTSFPIHQINDEYLQNYMIDEHTWRNFEKYYSEEFKYLEYATQFLVENGIVRKTCDKFQLAKHFMMCMLRLFLQLVPDVHTSHMNPIKNLVHPPRIQTLTFEQIRDRIQKKNPIITITYANGEFPEGDPLYF